MASPAISSSSTLFLVIFFPFFFSSSSVFSTVDNNEVASELVSREFFPMEGDVAWVVQISDLHLSAYHPERAEDLAGLFGSAMRIIRPDLLLVTGDITDAKNRKRTSTRQDESEWIQYRDTIDALVKESDIDRRRIFDIRGNHDKYGVPYVGSALDFFSIYSVSSQFNRLATIHSVSLVGDGRSYIFLGIDDTMRIGIRGPSNFFGHPTSERIHAVQAELQYWDSHPGPSVTKVVFGHFPMSFTASAENGERYEPVFARQSISAYICGHLHSKFGKQLWRLHASKEHDTAKQFWEWELGDWKESRLMRILAIDQGDVSFLDIELPRISEPHGEFKTTIHITYPVDSRSMSRVKKHTQSVRNDINALVFSVQPIHNVTAKVLDSLRDFKLVEEIPLQPANKISSKGKPLYRTKWNAENYISASATQYWLQVLVIDSQGRQTASIPRPFSVEGRRAKFSPSWRAFLIFKLKWEDVYYSLHWCNVSFLILLLCLPKLLNLFMERNSSYQKWAMSVPISSFINQRRFVFRLFWFLIEGSRIKVLWHAMVVYFVYLLTMPWFWGQATSEKGNVFKLCLSGWAMQPSRSVPTSGRLGLPDVMTITLPFMYMVVTPLFLLIYGFSAERSAAFFHSSENTKCSKVHLDGETNKTFLGPYNCITRWPGCMICAGWLRKALLFACAVIACIHLMLVFGIMEAYGARPVALSPAVSWVPLLFLAIAVYSTITKA